MRLGASRRLGLRHGQFSFRMISTWETQGSTVCYTARDANLRLAGTTGEVLPTTRPESFLEFLYLKALDFGAMKAGYCFILCLIACLAGLQTEAQTPEPIIDMHLHALHGDELGPPPLFLCAPFLEWPLKDPQEDVQSYYARVQNKPSCPSPLRSGMNDTIMKRTIAILNQRNIYAVTNSISRDALEVVEKWKQAGGERILPAIPFDPKCGKPTVEELRQLVKSKRVMAFAEVGVQYEGIGVTDPRMEPYFALAEELDVPVGIHMGPGPPGAPYVVAPSYRMRLSSLLTLEDVLVRHPK